MPEEEYDLVRGRRRLDRSASANDIDDRGWTLLHIYASKDDRKGVRRLLKEGMDANVTAWGPKSHGITPLHLAAKGGHLKVMDELLERGADIDARTKGACGWTPLHNAAKERKKRAIKFLVENGAFLPDDINDARFNLHFIIVRVLNGRMRRCGGFSLRILLPVRHLTALKIEGGSHCCCLYVSVSPEMKCFSLLQPCTMGVQK